MYDKDGNGKLDKQEVKRIIKVRIVTVNAFVGLFWFFNFMFVTKFKCQVDLGFSTGFVTTADYRAAVIRLMALGHDLRVL